MFRVFSLQEITEHTEGLGAGVACTGPDKCFICLFSVEEQIPEQKQSSKKSTRNEGFGISGEKSEF